jgi:putative proteasome-type protease
LAPSHRLRLEEHSAELETMTRDWVESVRHAFFGLPHFPWEQPDTMGGTETGSPHQMQS